MTCVKADKKANEKEPCFNKWKRDKIGRKEGKGRGGERESREGRASRGKKSNIDQKELGKKTGKVEKIQSS